MFEYGCPQNKKIRLNPTQDRNNHGHQILVLLENIYKATSDNISARIVNIFKHCVNLDQT
jgi:hypothetical protein